MIVLRIFYVFFKQMHYKKNFQLLHLKVMRACIKHCFYILKDILMFFENSVLVIKIFFKFNLD